MTDIQIVALIVGLLAILAPWMYKARTNRFPWEEQ